MSSRGGTLTPSTLRELVHHAPVAPAPAPQANHSNSASAGGPVTTAVAAGAGAVAGAASTALATAEPFTIFGMDWRWLLGGVLIIGALILGAWGIPKLIAWFKGDSTTNDDDADPPVSDDKPPPAGGGDGGGGGGGTNADDFKPAHEIAARIRAQEQAAAANRDAAPPVAH